MRNNIQVVGSSGEETRDMMALWGPIRIWALMLKKCDLLYIVPKGRKRIKTFTYKLKMYIIREDAFVVRLAQMGAPGACYPSSCRRNSRDRETI